MHGIEGTTAWRFPLERGTQTVMAGQECVGTIDGRQTLPVFWSHQVLKCELEPTEGKHAYWYLRELRSGVNVAVLIASTRVPGPGLISVIESGLAGTRGP